MQITPHTNPSRPGEPQGPENLREKIAQSEKELASKRGSLETWRQAEVDLETTTQQQLKRLNDLAKQDGIYRRIRKFTPYTGMGSFPLVGACIVAGVPAIGLAALAVTIGSMALHQYSLKKDKEIDREFNPLNDDYRRNAGSIDSVRRNRLSLEHEVEVRQRELSEMKKSEADLVSMVDAVNAPEPKGSREVKDTVEKVVIDGVSLQKKTRGEARA